MDKWKWERSNQISYGDGREEKNTNKRERKIARACKTDDKAES